MNAPIRDDEMNKILLKPRFQIIINKSIDDILQKFETLKKEGHSKYMIKVVSNHVVIDIPDHEAHFWSPQLHFEVERIEQGKSLIKGLLGPKPKVWTFFMFLHFAIAIAFVVFFVMLYVKWSLNQNYHIALAMCLLTPVLSFGLYFAGQVGKKIGRKQIQELYHYLLKITHQ